MADAPLFVVDDDPTGAQGQEQVPILLAWSPSLLEEALSGRPRALHLLTNSRALDGEGAFAIVRDAVAAVRACVAEPRVVLRGDSTLRGHLLPEYLALRAGLAVTSEAALLVGPA